MLITATVLHDNWVVGSAYPSIRALAWPVFARFASEETDPVIPRLHRSTNRFINAIGNEPHGELP